MLFFLNPRISVSYTHLDVYKRQIQDLPEDAVISFYKQGDFVDLCAGPHVESTGKIKAFKLMSVAGAYWRGDSDKQMLQRIYATAFPSQELLDEYIAKIEEMCIRDRSPADPHFIGAWSLCHKMFSMRLIREHDLRFEQLYNAEDGVFTYRVLNCAEVISGCDTIAYNYIKRPFWLTPSATQIISRRYLKSPVSYTHLFFLKDL